MHLELEKQVGPSYYRVWCGYTIVLLLGYLTLGRSFAYLGIQPLRLFIGEITLAAFILLRPSLFLGNWTQSFTTAVPFRSTYWVLTLFIAYGLLLVLKGVFNEYPLNNALQDFVCHIYPLYFFMGVMIGAQDSALIRRFALRLGWVTGIYGVAYIVFLSKLHYLLPGTNNVILFGQPTGVPIALLGLIAFQFRFTSIVIPLLMNLGVMLADQVRSDWLAFIIGFVVWSYFSKKLGIFFIGVASLLGIFQIGFTLDFRYTGPRGEISSRAIVARAISPFAPELAQEYTSSEYVRVAKGTSEWRRNWWKLIWESVHADPSTALTGYGYGYPLSYLAPYIRDEAIRTPHNIFFYLLGYGGWINVLLFFGLQLTLLFQLYKAYKMTGQCFGIAVWGMTLTSAFFGNVYETPFGAIPLYLILGISSAIVINKKTAHHGVITGPASILGSSARSQVSSKFHLAR